jgi:CRISPR-associated protein Cas2
MAIHRPRTYLVAYDIADPKRLGRVHRLMVRAAAPLQYSVFVTRASDDEIDHLLDDVDGLIEPTEDDVRAYPIPERTEVVMLGRQRMPEGIILTAEGVGELLRGMRQADPKLSLDLEDDDEEE